MSQIKQTKTRINSAQTTAKITKAMQTIASMRLRKFQKQSNIVTKYFDSLMVSLGSTLSNNNSPILMGNPNGKTLVVIAGASRGFCGGLHRSIVLESYKNLKENNIDLANPENVEIITINKPTSRIVSKLGGNIKANFDGPYKNIDTYSVLPIAELVNRLWKKGDYKEIHITFAKSKNAIKPEIITQKILPFNIPKTESIPRVVNYDTSQEDIITEAISLCCQAIIHQGILSTQSSEEQARIVAMSQATDNAKTLENNLKIIYFRQRQAKITQEISEIISGNL
jgi:F-type H+-transporting ATPase subunit gamma